MLPRKTLAKNNFGYARPVALALRQPRLAFPALRVGVEALRSFFYPQFENALLRRRPVVNVDHPLDATIPFDHRYMKKYLTFIQLWMASFYKLWQFYGRRALPEMVAFLAAIRRLYAEAGSVYGVVHTTTTRPAKNYNLRFALIHAVDPHLDCIPSLHVLLVVSNWLLVSGIAGRLGPDGTRGFTEAELERWLSDLRGEAIAITESVLFVKQHSVNCIGASLYYLKRRFPDFDAEEAEAFTRDLFASDGIGLANAGEIRGVIRETCASMENVYALRPERGWRHPLLDFIDRFAED
jgi:hypothetical protein